MTDFSDRVLDRRAPADDNHIRKYSLSLPTTATVVNKILRLPRWHWDHDQGAQGACVGHGTSMMKSILDSGRRYNPWWLWDQAKVIDEWSDTNPGDDNGTSVRAACDVLRTQGHTRWQTKEIHKEWGIAANRWATTIDEMRSVIALGIPLSIGINWYSNFDSPVKKGSYYWIGEGDLGSNRGGHCVCIYGASDKRQAFRIKNSWGREYPLVWLPYTAMETLIKEDGEVALVTDL